MTRLSPAAWAEVDGAIAAEVDAARNIHAADEAVELASIAGGARTPARFIAGCYGDGGLTHG
jgi:hypothetical protein